MPTELKVPAVAAVGAVNVLIYNNTNSPSRRLDLEDVAEKSARPQMQENATEQPAEPENLDPEEGIANGTNRREGSRSKKRLKHGKNRAVRGAKLKSPTAGVYAQRTSGTWKVDISYKGERLRSRSLDIDQALLVNRVLREKLDATRNSKLTYEEIGSNIKLAIDAAREAISEASDGLNDSTSRDDGAADLSALIEVKRRPDVKDRPNNFVSFDEKSKRSSADDAMLDATEPEIFSRKRKAPTRFENGFVLSGPTKKAAKGGGGGIADRSARKEGGFRGKVPSLGGALSLRKEDTAAKELVADVPLDVPDDAEHEETNKKSQIAGLERRKTGNWAVRFSIQNEKLYLGTYSTREHAELINRVVRGKMKVAKYFKMSSDEFESNLLRAKDAAESALRQFKCGGDAKELVAAHVPIVGIPDDAEEAKSHEGINRKSHITGVYALVSGKWAATIQYHNETRHMGTFVMWEHAVLVRWVVQKKLETTKDSNLRADEIGMNLKLAKEAAVEALSKFKDGPNDTGALIALWDDASNRPTMSTPPGVVCRGIGTWDVFVQILGKQFYFGCFDNGHLAVLVNEIARGVLKAAKEFLRALSELTLINTNIDGLIGTASGKWRVEIDYQNASHYIGTFETREQAIVVKKVARQVLDRTRDLKLTADEIQRNVELAEDTACGALLNGAPQSHHSIQLDGMPKDCEVIRWKRSSSPQDWRTVGVRQVRSGKWMVEIDYQNASHFIGTFETREQAILVKKVARQVLDGTRDSKLTADQIQRNVELAEDAACRALLNGAPQSQQSIKFDGMPKDYEPIGSKSSSGRQILETKPLKM